VTDSNFAMAVTARLCERIAATAYENLGTPAIEAARRGA